MAKKTYRELNTKGKKRYIQKSRDVISNINNAQTYVANTKTIYNEENLKVRIKWFQNLIQNLDTSKDSLYLQVIPLSDNQFSIVRISDHTARKDNNIIGRENVYADLWLSLFFDFNGRDKAIPFNGDINREKVSQEQLSQGIPLQRPRNVTQKIAYEINGKHLFVENDVQLLLASIKGFLENGIYTFPFNNITENKQYNTMNNTKKRIRLTESDLHKLIKEAINELDWKTYANAANKRYSQSFERNNDVPYFDDVSRRADMRIRSKRLADMAKKAFDRDHGYEDDKVYAGLGGDFHSTNEFAPHIIGLKDKGYGNPYKYEGGHEWDSYYPRRMDITPEEFFDNDEAATAFNNSKKELSNYKKGNYEYEKGGRGWHLKDGLDESIRRAIRKVLK